MGDPDVWPVLLDMSRDDCKRILRRLELEAYSNLVSVLRAQGSLTAHKRRLLQNVAQALGISEERHKAECRRAVNSEKLATIAKHVGGANSGTEWAIEGRRLVPLLPRLVPQTAFTAIADKVANMAMTEGAKLPLPTAPVKKRLSSPPIDESLLEPSVPEASKTHQASSGSPMTIQASGAELQQQPQSGKPFYEALAETSEAKECPEPCHISPPPSTQHGCSSCASTITIARAQITLPPTDPTPQTSIKEEECQAVPGSQGPVVFTITPNNLQTPVQHQAVPKSQVVLLVKTEDRLQDDRLSRKRPRSASLDMPLNIPAQGSTMPPPFKKEILSPLSPHGVTSPLAQLPATMSPQTHSQVVQQQTLAAAAAAALSSSASPQAVAQPQPTPHGIQQLQQPSPPPLPLPSQAIASTLQSLTPAPQASVPSPNPSGRTITIPSQGAVKLSLTSATSSAGSGIPSGTHKVIIVSSTTPSILQRSLSVPVVKSLSTSAPSQPCSSTLVLNTSQQTQQASNNASTTPGGSETISNSSSHQVISSTIASKVQGKIVTQPSPKVRPRANSIVIPVTPNQANVMNSVGVTSVQLKSALQGKQGILKSADAAGLKILPLASVNPNSKLLQKASGSGPMYVVSTTSTANPSVSMVARTVSSGQRIMTFTSSVPKVAVSSSQPVQTLQLAQATSSGSIPLSTASGKPNVIVVQKGRGVTLSHAGKEVVGKVLLGGKALTSLNQNQTQAVTTSASPSTPLSQIVTSQTPQISAQSQASLGSLSSTTSTPTRVLTVQKMPSAVVQGASGSGNVIVLDLSQEQLNNSAVLNEILASSILQSSSNVINFSHGTVTEAGSTSVNSLKGLINFNCEQTDTSSGLLLSDDKNILLESFDQSLVSHSDNIDAVANHISSDISVEVTERFFEDDSCFSDGGQSTNGNTTAQSSRVHTDICAAAMSNANLNLNDFLDDSSLDDIQPISLEAMRMDITTAAGDDTEKNSICGPIDERVESLKNRVTSVDILSADGSEL